MMNVPLKPEHEHFISEQVKTGRFDSVEDAVANDLRAIEEGLAQADRGEGFTRGEVVDHLHRRGIDVR